MMFGEFFGEYLLKHEVVTEEQLEAAMRCQKEHHILLGTLAVNKGYLSSQQVSLILDEQQKVNHKFGWLAVEKGFLSPEQVQELIREQGENHIYLGEALIRLGYVSMNKLQVHLNAFQQHLQGKEQAFAKCLQHFPQAEILHRALGLIVEYFYRLGFVLKIKDMERHPDISSFNPVFLGTQNFSDRNQAFFGMQLSWNAARLMAQGNDLRFEAGENQLQLFEATTDAVNNLNFVLCEELQRLGYRVKPGAMHFVLPQQAQESVKILFHSMIGPLYLLYYFN